MNLEVSFLYNYRIAHRKNNQEIFAEISFKIYKTNCQALGLSKFGNEMEICLNYDILPWEINTLNVCLIYSGVNLIPITGDLSRVFIEKRHCT